MAGAWDGRWHMTPQLIARLTFREQKAAESRLGSRPVALGGSLVTLSNAGYAAEAIHFRAR
jgi:hypothetical protein